MHNGVLGGFVANRGVLRKAVFNNKNFFTKITNNNTVTDCCNNGFVSFLLFLKEEYQCYRK